MDLSSILSDDDLLDEVQAFHASSSGVDLGAGQFGVPNVRASSSARTETATAHNNIEPDIVAPDDTRAVPVRSSDKKQYQKERNRRKQAMYRQRLKAQLTDLQTRTKDVQDKLLRAEAAKQRLEIVSSELMTRLKMAAYALDNVVRAPSSSAGAHQGQHTQETVVQAGESSLVLKSAIPHRIKRGIPRRLETYARSATVSYEDILPHLPRGKGKTRFRTTSSSIQDVADFTEAQAAPDYTSTISFVDISLVREALECHQRLTQSGMGTIPGEVCWYVALPYEVRPGLRLSHSSSMASPECHLSTSIAFWVVTLEATFLKVLEDRLIKEEDAANPQNNTKIQELHHTSSSDLMQEQDLGNARATPAHSGQGVQDTLPRVPQGPLKLHQPRLDVLKNHAVMCGENHRVNILHVVQTVMSGVAREYRKQLPLEEWGAVCMQVMHAMKDQVQCIEECVGRRSQPPAACQGCSEGDGMDAGMPEDETDTETRRQHTAAAVHASPIEPQGLEVRQSTPPGTTGVSLARGQLVDLDHASTPARTTQVCEASSAHAHSSLEPRFPLGPGAQCSMILHDSRQQSDHFAVWGLPNQRIHHNDLTDVGYEWQGKCEPSHEHDATHHACGGCTAAAPNPETSKSCSVPVYGPSRPDRPCVPCGDEGRTSGLAAQTHGPQSEIGSYCDPVCGAVSTVIGTEGSKEASQAISDQQADGMEPCTWEQLEFIATETVKLMLTTVHDVYQECHARDSQDYAEAVHLQPTSRKTSEEAGSTAASVDDTWQGDSRSADDSGVKAMTHSRLIDRSQAVNISAALSANLLLTDAPVAYRHMSQGPVLAVAWAQGKQMRVYQYLRLTRSQKESFAAMWHGWQRRRAALDKEFTAALSLLSSSMPDHRLSIAGVTDEGTQHACGTTTARHTCAGGESTSEPNQLQYACGQVNANAQFTGTSGGIQPQRTSDGGARVAPPVSGMHESHALGSAGQCAATDKSNTQPSADPAGALRLTSILKLLNTSSSEAAMHARVLQRLVTDACMEGGAGGRSGGADKELLGCSGVGMAAAQMALSALQAVHTADDRMLRDYSALVLMTTWGLSEVEMRRFWAALLEEQVPTVDMLHMFRTAASDIAHEDLFLSIQNMSI